MLLKSAGLAGINECINWSKRNRIFNNEDVVAPAKIINDFAKKNEALEIKAGIIEGNVSTAEDVKALAELPSREGLLSMLLSYFKLQSATSHLLQKQLQNKKKNKARNLQCLNYKYKMAIGLN